MTQDDMRIRIYQRVDALIDDLAMDNQKIPDDIGDVIADLFEERRQELFLCDELGHHWVDDQCGKPEHKYCFLCGIGIDTQSNEVIEQQKSIENRRKDFLRRVSEREVFQKLEDGFTYFFLGDNGGISTQQLRWLADELDRRNTAWQAQIERDLAELGEPHDTHH